MAANHHAHKLVKDSPWLLATQVGLICITLLLASTLLIIHLGRIETQLRGKNLVLETPTQTSKTRIPRKRKHALNRQLLDNVVKLATIKEEPTNVDRFLVLTRRRAILLLILLQPTIYFLVKDIINASLSDKLDLLPVALNACYILTYLVMAGSIHTSLDMHSHAVVVRDLFALSTFVTLTRWLLDFGTTLVPRHPFSWTVPVQLLSNLAQMIAIGLIPRRPVSRIDKRNLYNRAVRRAIEQPGPIDSSQSALANDEVSGELSSCMFSWIAQTWVVPVISRAARMDQIDVQQIPAMGPDLRYQEIVKDLDEKDYLGVDMQNNMTVWGLMVLLWAGQKKTILLWLCLAVLRIPFDYFPHFSLQMFLTSLEHRSDLSTAVSWAGLILLARFSRTVLGYIRSSLRLTYVEPRTRAHALLLVYKKLLTRNTYASTKETDPALAKVDVLNVIRSDVAYLEDVDAYIQGIVTSQLELVLGGFYIWTLLGVSGLFGLATLLLPILPAYLVTRLQWKIFADISALRDERVSLLKEAINAISMIKLMAAEVFWYRRISKIRDKEFKQQFKASCLGLLSAFVNSLAPSMLLIVSFGHYTLVKKQTLTASVAFTAINIFDELRPVLTALPEHVADLARVLISARRVTSFLRASDIEPLEQEIVTDNLEGKDFRMRGTVTWDATKSLAPTTESDTTPLLQDANVAPTFALRDLDVTFRRGQFTLVAGKFGSGKTLLLLALLGEAHLVEGEITYALSSIMPPDLEQDPFNADWSVLPVMVAYAPQLPWLLSASIRQNILFGLPMNFDRYKRVIHAVGLLPDLAQLDDEDLTEIGERGKILSGGQKARVSLARAMYSRASTIILDDVMSAVDASTSHHIVRHCFQSDLSAGRTIIIASHAVESLAPIAHEAIFLEEGRVVYSGTGPELLESVYMDHLRAEQSLGKSVVEEAPLASDTALSSGGARDDFRIQEQIPKTPRQLIIEDARGEGTVKYENWKQVIKDNGGWLYWTGMAILMLLSSLAPLATLKILEHWTSDSSAETGALQSTILWVSLFCAASLLCDLLYELRALYGYFGQFAAAAKVHRECLEALLRATPPLFTKTRVGSLLERFGSDINEVQVASRMLVGMASRIFSISITTITITHYGGWPFGLAIFLALCIMYKPSVWYRSASRQLRRLEKTVPGLVNALYGETVAGVGVIRAFGAQSVMLNELIQTLNMKLCIQSWRLYTSRWLTMQLKILEILLLSMVLAVTLISGNMSASTAGFVISFVGTITMNLNWAMIDLRNLELNSISLERIADFRKAEQESYLPLDIPEELSASDWSIGRQAWPANGHIKATGLCARYEDDLPDILHDVSFEIQGGSRVGIVGASGGGKSTLAKTLFSFVQVSAGKIEIDGVDISTIPLGKLRSSLGIIAQDPVLLSGSLCLNLDIESRYPDAELYAALRQVQLIKAAGGSKAATPAVSRVPTISSQLNVTSSETGDGDSCAETVVEPQDATIFNDLDFEIKTGGENLSAGQKQLVILARALLKKHKICIMDEATASIDSETDQAISRVVHEGFEGATVLIIAHRLRILVLDKGHIVQQGSPFELIREQGKFKELCEAAGKEEYLHLVSLAESHTKQTDGVLVQV